jgi:hypothetical protein
MHRIEPERVYVCAVATYVDAPYDVHEAVMLPGKDDPHQVSVRGYVVHDYRNGQKEIYWYATLAEAARKIDFLKQGGK